VSTNKPERPLILGKMPKPPATVTKLKCKITILKISGEGSFLFVKLIQENLWLVDKRKKN